MKMSREEFEDMYRKAWIAQTLKDAKVNHFIRPNKYQQSGEKAKNAGHKGGRPKTGNNIKMTGPAQIVNNLLKTGMSMRKIGEIVGKSHQAVSEMARRYGMPRE